MRSRSHDKNWLSCPNKVKKTSSKYSIAAKIMGTYILAYCISVAQDNVNIMVVTKTVISVNSAGIVSFDLYVCPII